MNLCFYPDLETGEPHIYNRRVTEEEAADILRAPGEDRAGWDEERVRKVLAHYEEQTEAALVPVMRGLIASVKPRGIDRTALTACYERRG